MSNNGFESLVNWCKGSSVNIKHDKFVLFAYQYYLDDPNAMKKWFPDMYKLIKESVE
jgi:hypothetical protein